MRAKVGCQCAGTGTDCPVCRSEEVSASALRDRVLAFVSQRQAVEPGRYCYAAGCTVPTVYSSCYAAMTRHLLGDLGSLAAAERQDWIAYLQAHQDGDGLFRDPV